MQIEKAYDAAMRGLPTDLVDLRVSTAIIENCGLFLCILNGCVHMLTVLHQCACNYDDRLIK